MTRRTVLFRATLLLFVAMVIGSSFVVAEMAYRQLNDIEIFPDEEILPKDIYEHYAFTLFRRSSNEALLYEPNPNARFRQYTINADGFRGPAVSIEKPPGTFRIVMLGDSIIWGHALDEPQTLSAQLEAKLNGVFPKKRFEVLNFGVSGYSTQQEVELFNDRARRFEPDLVIVGFCLNDFEESSVEALPFKRLTLGMRSKSYLFENVNRAVYHFARRNFSISIKPRFILQDVDVRKEFERLQEMADARILLLIFPELTEFENYPLHHLHRDVVSAVRGLEVDTIDLLEAFEVYDPEQLKVSPEDVTHPNQFANGVAADQIVDYVKREIAEPGNF